jgi:hypothetical protein
VRDFGAPRLSNVSLLCAAHSGRHKASNVTLWSRTINRNQSSYDVGYIRRYESGGVTGLHGRSGMSRRFMLAGALALCLIGSGAALAQNTAKPPQDALAAARELVLVMRAADQVKQILPSIFQALRSAIVQGRPEAEKDFDALVPALLDNMNARTTELVELMALIYARNFTAEEMRGMMAFYQTSLGQKLLQKMPTIAQESLTAGQAWGRQIGAEVQSRMIEELRKKGHNI